MQKTIYDGVDCLFKSNPFLQLGFINYTQYMLCVCGRVWVLLISTPEIYDDE